MEPGGQKWPPGSFLFLELDGGWYVGAESRAEGRVLPVWLRVGFGGVLICVMDYVR